MEQRAMCDHFRSTLTHCSLECLPILEEFKFFLKDQLASHKIPSFIVADIHSCVGLIQDKLGNPRSAILSLMNALWIQQKINDLQDACVVKALTEHRLARLYAQVKEYDSAVSLIEKAYSAYQQSKMKPDHEVYKECVECLQSYRLKLLELKMVERGTLHSTLSVVDEGSTLSLFEEDASSTSSSNNSSPKQFAALGA
jgi:tetratricopeptide (TPR) repeat protein